MKSKHIDWIQGIKFDHQVWNGPRAYYQIRKIAGRAWARNAGNIFPETDFKENRKLVACIMARAWPLFVKKPMTLTLNFKVKLYGICYISGKNDPVDPKQKMNVSIDFGLKCSH